MSECQRLKIAFPVYAQRVPQPQATVFHTKYEGPFCRILLRCILVEEKIFFSLSRFRRSAFQKEEMSGRGKKAKVFRQRIEKFPSFFYPPPHLSNLIQRFWG